jgi:hypothetical protein
MKSGRPKNLTQGRLREKSKSFALISPGFRSDKINNVTICSLAGF